jgi:hypothetical protein
MFLAQDSQQLLTTPPGIDGRPVSVAELWPDAIASVIQIQETVPQWNPHNVGVAHADAIQSALQTQASKIIDQLLTFDATAQRLNFVPDQSVQSAAGTTPPAATQP